MLSTHSLPARTDVLVIGGGPAGSYAATLLARDGFVVTLLEREVFPRYHIGESLLPSSRQFLSLIDAENLIDSHGFTPKPGGAFKLSNTMRESYTSFVDLGSKGSWNVIRSEFDDLLLKHASTCGVHVFEGTEVSNIYFDKAGPNRPLSASWEGKDGASGTIHFDWLVDASGHAGLMATKYFHNRRVNSTLKNIACWGYWTGGGVYGPGTKYENSPWFGALTDQTGWAWYIPLHDGTISLGFVMSEAASAAKRKALNARGYTPADRSATTAHYLDQLQFVPFVADLLKEAALKSEIKSASDYSYSAPAYSGDHYRLVGDAAAFIDPLFSSGVHLAFTSALSAACSIAASSRGSCSEQEANRFHDLKTRTAYTRFVVLVLGIYKQIRAQSDPVIHDVDEDTFDRAFALLRPLIQGSGDVGKELTEDEVQKAMDFCFNVIAPVDSAQMQAVMQRVDPGLLAKDASFTLPKQLDEEAVYVLNKINAFKTVGDITDISDFFNHEEFGGYRMQCEKTHLDLVAVDGRDGES